MFDWSAARLCERQFLLPHLSRRPSKKLGDRSHVFSFWVIGLAAERARKSHDDMDADGEKRGY
jgi:hypothetical protein